MFILKSNKMGRKEDRMSDKNMGKPEVQIIEPKEKHLTEFLRYYYAEWRYYGQLIKPDDLRKLADDLYEQVVKPISGEVKKQDLAVVKENLIKQLSELINTRNEKSGSEYERTEEYKKKFQKIMQGAEGIRVSPQREDFNKRVEVVIATAKEKIDKLREFAAGDPKHLETESDKILADIAERIKEKGAKEKINELRQSFTGTYRDFLWVSDVILLGAIEEITNEIRKTLAENRKMGLQAQVNVEFGGKDKDGKENFGKTRQRSNDGGRSI